MSHMNHKIQFKLSRQQTRGVSDRSRAKRIAVSNFGEGDIE